VCKSFIDDSDDLGIKFDCVIVIGASNLCFLCEILGQYDYIILRKINIKLIFLK